MSEVTFGEAIQRQVDARAEFLQTEAQKQTDAVDAVMAAHSQIAFWQQQIDNIQAKCQHKTPDILGTHKGRTFPKDWILTLYRCPECLKQWEEKVEVND